MKNRFGILTVILSIVFCIASSAQETYYGKKINNEGAITMPELTVKMKETKTLKDVKVTGKVTEVCQEMGCWMTMDNANGDPMRVRFKGHSYFIPKNSAGKTAVIEGTVSVDETSVEDLKHYAEDAGKSKEEIMAIKDPKTELVFVADGVILKD